MFKEVNWHDQIHYYLYQLVGAYILISASWSESCRGLIRLLALKAGPLFRSPRQFQLSYETCKIEFFTEGNLKAPYAQGR